MRTSWSSAVKIAEREARASLGKFVFVILAVAAGVGALTGVRGFSGAFQGMLLRDARTLMAGDLSVRLFAHPNPEQQEAFDKLTERGVERTWISETISMMSSADSPRPLMVTVKAVEPDLYPFYGQIKLAPEGGLNDVLDAESMVVSSDLLLRLKLNRGDSVMLGDEQFRIVAEVLVEPDRMTGTMNVGPRVMISRDGLERTRLIQPGSRASQRYLFRLPPERISIAESRGILETAFQGDRIVDFRETHPTLRRGLDRATKFLSLVSLIALIVGALGVAMAMHSHLQQRLDTIAIMKCVGGSSGQIMRIYLLQTIALGLVGSLLGVLVGYGMQTLFPVLIANYFPEISGLEWQPIAALQGVLIGVLTTLLFTVPTLLSVRRVRPAVIFRRDMDGARLTMGERLRQWRGFVLARRGHTSEHCRAGCVARRIGPARSLVRGRSAGESADIVRRRLGNVARATGFPAVAPLEAATFASSRCRELASARKSRRGGLGVSRHRSDFHSLYLFDPVVRADTDGSQRPAKHAECLLHQRHESGARRPARSAARNSRHQGRARADSFGGRTASGRGCNTCRRDGPGEFRPQVPPHSNHHVAIGTTGKH